MSHNRRQQRRFAFQVLYSLSFATGVTENVLLTTFDNFWTEENPEQDRRDSYAWALTKGVLDNAGDIDALISSHSEHWKFNRIAKVELTILRLSLFEMLHCPDVPVKVVLNEAVELAKHFGDENSRTFVNGILDAAAKSREHQEQ